MKGVRGHYETSSNNWVIICRVSEIIPRHQVTVTICRVSEAIVWLHMSIQTARNADTLYEHTSIALKAECQNALCRVECSNGDGASSLYIHTHARVHAFIDMYMYMYIYIHTYIHNMNVSWRAYYIDVCAHTHTHKHIDMYVCICVYVYICIHT